MTPSVRVAVPTVTTTCQSFLRVCSTIVSHVEGIVIEITSDVILLRTGVGLPKGPATGMKDYQYIALNP